MAYAFTQSKRVGKQVREIAIEQIDKALETVQGDGDFDRAVHSLRRSCKKLRALLLLVRPCFRDYRVENDAIKAIADQFSVARDAAVMVETLADVVGANRPHPGPGAEHAAVLIDQLRTRSENLRQQMGETQLLQSSAQQLEAARARVKDWSFDASGPDIVLPGLKKSYSRFCDEFKAARDEPSGEVMHEWRKAAKAYWYHVRLFRRSAPHVLDAHADALDALGEMLGDHHNLTVLLEWIDAAGLPAGEATETVRPAITERQKDLAENAFALGRQFTAEKPSALLARFERYWQWLE